MVDKPMVKGTGVRAMMRLAETKGVKDRVLARLPPEDRQLLSGNSILPTSRYPEETDHRLLLAVCQEVYPDVEKATELGKAVLDEGMNIFSRLFLKVGDPMFLISKAGVMWAQFHQVGKVDVYEVGKGTARARLTDYPWLDLAFCRVFTGTILRALELSGCKNIQVAHEKCVGKRDPHCQYHVTWQ